MSRLGKLLLTMCDNDMSVDLKWVASEHPTIPFARLRVTAIMLGLTIKGGS